MKLSKRIKALKANRKARIVSIIVGFIFLYSLMYSLYSLGQQHSIGQRSNRNIGLPMNSVIPGKNTIGCYFCAGVPFKISGPFRYGHTCIGVRLFCPEVPIPTLAERHVSQQETDCFNGSKQFKDEKLGFSLRYPCSFYASKSEIDNRSVRFFSRSPKVTVDVHLNRFDPNDDDPCSGAKSQTDVCKHNFSLYLTDKNIASYGYDLESKTQLEINNYAAAKYSTICNKMLVGGPCMPTTSIVINKDDRQYYFFFWNTKEINDDVMRILNSFTIL